MEVPRKAVVVGAGIGGLAAAGALAADGWQVTVLERADELRPLGSGIALWRNALTALDILAPGLAAELRKKPTLRGLAGLRTADGRWVGRLRASSVSRTDSTADVPISVGRPELYAGLRACVPEEAFRFGRTVESVRETTDGAVVHATHATHAAGADDYDAQLVVAADGIGSRLRAMVDPRPKVRSAGYISWRGMVPPADAPELADGGETWGLGQRFGMNVMSDGGVYWYATLSDTDQRAVKLNDNNQSGDDRAQLLEFFAGWHDPIRTLIERTPPGTILRHDTPMLWPLPRTFVAGHLALLGDAAHAMTPDLGQGACQALEDAVELAAVVREVAPKEIPQALRRYDTLRRPRTTKLAKQARMVSRFSQLRNPVAAGLRNGLLRIAGLGAAAGGFESIVSWQPSHGPSRSSYNT